MHVELSKEELIYCAPINEKTSRWGVYCIPKLWRMPDGRIAIVINGESDSPDAHENICPDLYYISGDNGKSWKASSNTEIDKNAYSGVDSPYRKLSCGKIISIQEKSNLQSFSASKWEKEFYTADKLGICRTFLQASIDEDVFLSELHTFDADGNFLSVEPVKIDFPDRELIVQTQMWDDTCYIDIPARFRSTLVCNPYISSITELSDGTLVGTCSGQCPQITDRYCAEVYLMESSDGGKNWKKRATVTKNSHLYAFGLLGDGGECSLTQSENGDLFLLTRTDMSNDHPSIGGGSDAYLFVSNDNGYTWSNERSASDSSVTPHVLSLSGNILVVIYGRPGVHMKISTDGGQTFGDSISIIGKTLEEELAEGKTYMEAKYFDMRSYSNSFIEKISDNSFIIVYTDMKYDPGDGKFHKATLVRTITIK